MWFEIHVQNIERAKKFYEAVLGVKLEHMKPPGPASEEMVTFPMEMNASGAAGALVKMHGVPSGRNSIIVYFQCDDCAAECKRVPVNGGKITKEEFAIGEHGFISLLNDTEGNVIGLHSMK